MSESEKKLHFVKDGVDTAITLYDTVANAGGDPVLPFFDGTAVRFACLKALGGTSSGLGFNNGSSNFNVYSHWAKYRITINQQSNELVTVAWTHNGTTTNKTESFDAWHGDTLTASVTSTNSAYNVGSVTGLNGTVTGTQSISATAATQKSYTFNISQSANQTIYVRTNRGTYTSTFTCYHGDTWNAWVSPASGYNAGSISSSSGTVTGNTSVWASGASLASVTFTVSNTSGSKVYVSIGSSSTYKYSTRYTINNNSSVSVSREVGQRVYLWFDGFSGGELAYDTWWVCNGNRDEFQSYVVNSNMTVSVTEVGAVWNDPNANDGDSGD